MCISCCGVAGAPPRTPEDELEPVGRLELSLVDQAFSVLDHAAVEALDLRFDAEFVHASGQGVEERRGVDEDACTKIDRAAVERRDLRAESNGIHALLIRDDPCAATGRHVDDDWAARAHE